MKKILLVISLILAYSYSDAQYLSGVNPTLNVSSTSTSSISQAFVTIHNSSISPIDVKVERTTNTLAPGHGSYFCWDVCYGESTNLSDDSVRIPPGADNNDFYGDLDPHGNAGYSTVCYNFFDMYNLSDVVSLCFNYDIATGIQVASVTERNPLSVASPNPANTITGINYYTNATQGSRLVIYNLLGGKVYETNLKQKQGTHVLNVADFQQGVYLYSLIENGKSIATKKLVVAHK